MAHHHNKDKIKTLKVMEILTFSSRSIIKALLLLFFIWCKDHISYDAAYYATLPIISIYVKTPSPYPFPLIL
jgi:hypothetical protein